jgi:hypothetical protein
MAVKIHIVITNISEERTSGIFSVGNWGQYALYFQNVGTHLPNFGIMS